MEDVQYMCQPYSLVLYKHRVRISVVLPATVCWARFFVAYVCPDKYRDISLKQTIFNTDMSFTINFLVS
jgi:hypothetical protein